MRIDSSAIDIDALVGTVYSVNLFYLHNDVLRMEVDKSRGDRQVIHHVMVDFQRDLSRTKDFGTLNEEIDVVSEVDFLVGPRAVNDQKEI